ncbi:ABC transporter substrate-binding protein [Ahrensia marina]|uniref:ABC transporter substrate-binding protein n=1 Tax=Ahrensia marina TaxID=1514904 RepID=UPI0035CF0C2C
MSPQTKLHMQTHSAARTRAVHSSFYTLKTTLLVAGVLAAAALAGATLGKADDAPVTITDVNGNTVTLAAPSVRSAPLPPPLGTFAIAIPGDADHLVAAHPWSKAVMMQGSLSGYFPNLVDLPTGAIGGGFVPNIEELLATDPDLVFQVGFMGEDVLAPIMATGLPVLTINVTANDDAVDWIPMMGAAYGVEDRAQTILSWRQNTLASITETLADLPDEGRPTVAHLARYGDALRVVGGGHFRSWQIEAMGGVNVAAEVPQRSAEISAEQLIVWDPDVILLNAFQPELTPQMVYDNPVLQSLTAVRERQIYAFPVGGDRWEAPVAESPLGWMWLSELLHPDRFQWDYTAEITSAHQLLYGHAPEAGDIARMLRIDANQNSAGYERFSTF